MYIDGYSLTIDDIINSLNNEKEKVLLSEEARKKCSDTREQINKWLEKDGPVVYGINTGLGDLKDTVLSPKEHLNWNKTIPYPHAVGMGSFLSPKITRAALLIRANVLARSFSAVRPELIERILTIYNNNIAPAVVEYGSTGLSDLSPLAQCAMVIAGLDEAKVIYNDKVRSAKDVYKELNIEEVFPLQCKEVLAIMNGSTMTQSIAVIAYHNLELLFNRIKENSNIKIKSSIIQDIEESLNFAGNIINFENNITCDNPLLFKIDDGSYEPVMGCNCSNTQVGYVLDILSMIAADCGEIITNNIECIMSGNCYALGAFNTCKGLLNELKNMCFLVSADSIPTKANQEDHVEFSYQASRKSLKASYVLREMVSILEISNDNIDSKDLAKISSIINNSMENIKCL